MIPIIECGHGGMIDGVYQDLASKKLTPDPKQYTFTDGTTIFEGVNNREIAKILIQMLVDNNEAYVDLNSTDQRDAPLRERTNLINSMYAKNKDLWLLSIHSNKMSKNATGPGNNGRGCETYIAIGASLTSQKIQKIAETIYREDGHKWRGSNSANFWMVKETNCPALLTENYFYDNREDARILLSVEGRTKIAKTLFKIIQKVKWL